MIRGAVIHFSNEQPLVCDLRALPAPGDSGLLLTNLRYVDGRKPTFIDHADSWFLFPVTGIRFMEIPGDAIVDHPEYPALPAGQPVAAAVAADGTVDDDDPLADVDESLFGDELLRRIRDV